MENMVWLEKLGIRDEDLLAVNPRLIIAHISGYGNPAFGGLPEYCDRASYDMIGQAFSGWMGLNGEKDGDPVVGQALAQRLYLCIRCRIRRPRSIYQRSQDRQGSGS